jgi:cobalt-zinc-cadmium efflux system protein
MSHDHLHDGQHDYHTHIYQGYGNPLLWPLLLTLGFAVVEAAGGWFTGSLALLGDAGHMFSDAAALTLAWLGAWAARKPPSVKHSYGLVRAEVMVALVNGLLMLVVVTAIALEAIQRLHAPQPVQGGEVMLIAFLGLLVNLIVARRLSQNQAQHNLNSRAALLHVIGDILGSIAALAAGAVIHFTGWLPIDPILSLFISALILYSTFNLLREVLRVLMEGVPRHLDLSSVGRAMGEVAEVREVHDVHIWTLSSSVVALSAHVVLQDMEAWPRVLPMLREMLHERFVIDHVTLQPEIAVAPQSIQIAWHKPSRKKV